MKITDSLGTTFLKCYYHPLAQYKTASFSHLLLHELPFQRLFKVNLVWGREGKKGSDIFPSIGHLMGYVLRSEQMGNSTPLELRSG